MRSEDGTDIRIKTSGIRVVHQAMRDEMKHLRVSVATLSRELEGQLCHLSHHKAKVRKESVMQLRRILSTAGSNNEVLLSLLKNKMVRLIIVFELSYDQDSSVRNAVKLFVNWFIPKISQLHCIELLSPFWDIIIAHICVGLSHSNYSIRINALKITRLLLSLSKDVASQFGHKQTLRLLSHLSLIFKDLTNSGALSDTNNVKEVMYVVNILCDSCAHLIRTLFNALLHASDWSDQILHRLLLPTSHDQVEERTTIGVPLQEFYSLLNAIRLSTIDLIRQSSENSANCQVLCDLCSQALQYKQEQKISF